ncbi:MAG: CRISPR-associated endoribonuclease Cas6, partial [Bacteroidota bacterium]
MRFQITLEVLKPGQMLPLSYQYEISSWIYKLISRTDSAFGEFLHSQGYWDGKKRFKFFTFSNLWIPPRYEIKGDRIQVFSKEISFVISFLVPEAAHHMISGLFTEEQFRLGDRKSSLDLQVIQIRSLALPPAQRQMLFKTTSPLVVSKPQEDPSGRLHHKYLPPDDPSYSQYFFQNLKKKYDLAVKHNLVAAVEDVGFPQFQLSEGKVKKQGVIIKAHTPAQTKVIGYMYNFQLTAPEEWIRVGMLAGFGEENAQGFGATR